MVVLLRAPPEQRGLLVVRREAEAHEGPGITLGLPPSAVRAAQRQVVGATVDAQVFVDARERRGHDPCIKTRECSARARRPLPSRKGWMADRLKCATAARTISGTSERALIVATSSAINAGMSLGSGP